MKRALITSPESPFRLTLDETLVSPFSVVPAVAWLLAQAAAPTVPPAPAPSTAPTPPAPTQEAPSPVATARPHIRAVRTPRPPVIDGKLDDPAWKSAVPSDDFTQHFPDEGAPPTERTVVRILYDDDALYIGVDCEQVHSPVVKRLMRRDTQASSEGVWLDIDSRRDGVSAFHFSVNAAGVLGDAIHFNDLDYSSDWDAVWEGRAADTPRGYSVEMRIPLYVLRFEAVTVQDWGFQLRRFIEARQETDDWAFFPRSAGSYIPLFGRLDDLRNLQPRRSLQVRPFALGRVRHRAPDASAAQSTLTSGTDATASVGLDAKASVTNELALDLTFNPDFGQVEADTAVLNLSTFETFFPEKRPFFLEGIDAFATPRTLLYTRRIGHQPAAVTLGADEVLVDQAEPSTIYAAGKLVGTVGGRTTLGVLSAVTGRNDVLVRTANNGPMVARTAEPASAYNVLRWKRLVTPDASVGVLATTTNRFEPTYGPMQNCAATQVPPSGGGRCTNDAYTLSADGRWRSPRGAYAVTAQALTTALAYGPARKQTDGIDVQPGTPAAGGTLNVDKVGGKNWLWGVDQQVSGRQLEFNDLGYLDRKNDYLGTYTLTYRTIEPWWKTVETRTTARADFRRTLDGIDLTRSASLTSWWLFSSYWAIQGQILGRAAVFDDREMGDGTALERASNWGGNLAVSGDPRSRVLWSFWGQALSIANGWHFDSSADVIWRVLPQLELELAPVVTYDQGQPRYVETLATHRYLLGAQEARSLGATVRASYTFIPELSLQVYSQAFLARVHYPAFFEGQVTGDRQRLELSALTPTTSARHDSLTSTLNVNVVLRWEYHLGSTAFLVYTRAQTPALTPAPGGATSLDVKPILDGRAAVDVIMLKIAYWFG
jgi:hypothetical protein